VSYRLKFRELSLVAVQGVPETDIEAIERLKRVPGRMLYG